VSGLSREQAREAAREELSRREYDAAQPPLLLRLIGRLLRELGELLDRLTLAAPGGPLAAVLLLALVAAVVALVLVRIGPLRRSARSAQLFAGSPVLSADGHRALADDAAAAGRYADAVRERLRAIVRELEARGVLDPRPGRTAGEVSREVGAAVPALADDLRRATTVFDEVWYGGRRADDASYRVLVEVDRRVSSSRLELAGSR
jgi:hypothetical protein